MSRFVLVTRHPADCEELQRLLAPAGLTVRPYPVLRVDDVVDNRALNRLSELPATDLDGVQLVFASPRAPLRFAHACRSHGLDHLLVRPASAVGPSTAKAAEEAGFHLAHVGRGTGADLASYLTTTWSGPQTVILACGRERRRELPETLAAAGHTVIPIIVYAMQPTPPRELPPLGPHLEAVVLTSPRAASLYLAGVGGYPLPCMHWALGPTTRDAAAALGIECSIPNQPNFESLAEELCRT